MGNKLYYIGIIYLIFNHGTISYKIQDYIMFNINVYKYECDQWLRSLFNPRFYLYVPNLQQNILG